MLIMKRRIKLVSIATIIIFTISVICSINSEVTVKAIEKNQSDRNTVVNIPDENLKNLIKNGLKVEDREITKADMEEIHSINLEDVDVWSLEGIQYCSNLEYIYIYKGSVSDLTPLSSLVNMKNIILENCGVSDLTPLKNLKLLESLEVENLQLDNYSVLSNLTNLTGLILNNCNIKDMGFVTKLDKLVNLDLSNNYINTIEGVNNLNNIGYFDLRNNEISNIKPLEDIPSYLQNGSSFSEGTINLEYNLIGNESYTESEEIIKIIEDKGYTVEIDKDSVKNNMHLMRINGKRFIYHEPVVISKDNEIELEFTEDIHPTEHIKDLDIFDYNINGITDYTVSYDKNILKIKINQDISTDEETYVNISDENITGLNAVIISVLGHNEEKNETIKILGDVNNDGVVDIDDLSIVANDYNKMKSNSDHWNEDEDCITDGIIDIYDISLICSKL